MAISEAISSTESSTTTLTNDISLVHVTGDFTGTIKLQVAPPDTSKWITILTFENPGTMPISSPDSTALYRFSPSLISGSAYVYIGA